MQVFVIRLEFNRSWINSKKQEGISPLTDIAEALKKQDAEAEFRAAGVSQCSVTVRSQQKSREIKDFLKGYIKAQYELRVEEGEYRLITKVRVVDDEEPPKPQEEQSRSGEGQSAGEAKAEGAGTSQPQPAEPEPKTGQEPEAQTAEAATTDAQAAEAQTAASQEEKDRTPESKEPKPQAAGAKETPDAQSQESREGEASETLSQTDQDPGFATSADGKTASESDEDQAKAAMERIQAELAAQEAAQAAQGGIAKKEMVGTAASQGADNKIPKDNRKMRINAFEEFMDEYRAILKKAKATKNEKLVWLPNLLLSMDEGYGISSSLEELADAIDEVGIIQFKQGGKRIREYTVTDPSEKQKQENDWNYVISEIRKISEMLDDSKGKERMYPSVICFDISNYRIQPTGEFNRILNTLSKYKGRFLFVFRIPYVEDIALKSVYQVLHDVFFVRKIVVPPADTAQLVAYATSVLKERGFEFAGDVSGEIEKLIAAEKMDGHFYGFRTISKLVDEIVYGKFLLQTGIGDTSVTKDDLLRSFPILMDDSEDPMVQLEKMCGMEEVKKTIDEIVSQIHMYQSMCASGHKMSAPCMHMRFVGSPGTGKTTVARLLAQILRKEGILKKGYFYEIKARDLCGRYVGETAPKTSRYCQDALGSVLFIDEAYTLFRDGKNDTYGREALDTLVTEMENNRDNLIVIMAGYQDEMDEMMEDANSGLASRMPYTISFRNYTKEELIDIFYLLMDNCFIYDDRFDTALRNFFHSISDSVLEDKNFANARMVRNLYERIWSKAAYRCRMSGDSEMRLLEEDILQATKEEEFASLLEPKGNGRIGF